MDSFKSLINDAVLSIENVDTKKALIRRYKLLRDLKPIPNDSPKQIIYIDSDGVIADQDSVKFGPRVYARLTPMKGAIEGVKTLMKYYDVYILTAVPIQALVIDKGPGDKLKWYKKYFPDSLYKKVIISSHKHLMKGNWLIDDRSVHGADKFGSKYSWETLEPGKWLHFGSKEYPDWKAILKFFKVYKEPETKPVSITEEIEEDDFGF